jgi:collagenase-like PrtC family protease
MYISGPNSWDRELIAGLTRINQAPSVKIPIKEVYGAQQRTIVGGGRTASIIPYVSDEEVEKQAALAHASDIEVNYLLNALCIGLREFEPKFHVELLEYLGWLNGIGVDYVTVTSTRLMGIIARQFPRLKLVVSINGEVDTPQKARYYVDQYNVSRINLDFNITRDFKQISAIRKAVDCEIEVLVNEPCLIYCPWKHDHQLDYAHGSQTPKDGQPLYAIDTPQCHCGLIRIEDRSQILKAPWLRPEDTVYLEEVGVNFVKLAGRAKPTAWILECAQAYAQQHFDGNVYNLIEKAGIRSPEYAACFGDDGMEPLRFHIDNRALDGFIKPFVAGKMHCRQGCEECGYCASWARKVVTVDESLAAAHLQKLRVVRDLVYTSEIPRNPSLVAAIRKKHEEKIGK